MYNRSILAAIDFVLEGLFRPVLHGVVRDVLHLRRWNVQNVLPLDLILVRAKGLLPRVTLGILC